jgi:hypothetical protein
VPSSTSDVSFGRQVLRRHVNVRLSDVAPTGVPSLDVFCECGGSHCVSRVRISADAFSAARSAGRYVVAPAHAGADADARHTGDGFALVDGRGRR